MKAWRIVQFGWFCLTVLPGAAQTWQLLDAGVGIYDDAVAPPRILERDKAEWGAQEMASRLGGKRYFGFWVVGPRPSTLVNRFGVPIYDWSFRSARGGEALVHRGRYGFSEHGWGGYQLDTTPGSYRVEVYVLNRDTGQEHLVKTLTYKVTASPGSNPPPTQPPSVPPGASQPPPRPGSGAEVYLSDLQESASGNIHGGLGKDKPYWAPEILMGGKRYAKGLVTAPGATPAKAFVEYVLGGRFSRFLATLGSASDKGNEGRGTMNYAILVDGRIAAQGRFPVPPATQEISIPLQGARTLRLEVDNGGDGHNSDHAAWGNARLKP